MDNMLEENKNLKDPERSRLGGTYGIDIPNLSVMLPSYNKTNKLISALYMVTDIMDKEEPLRTKLRNLGVNIISDIYLIQQNHTERIVSVMHSRITEILSLLEIASSVGIVSEMNSNILTKEFIELRKSIIEITPKNDQVWLQKFLNSSPDLSPHPDPLLNKERGNYKGHTSIGVQKGSTLLKALSKVEVSDRIPDLSRSRFEDIRNRRHEEIILIIKDKMKNSLNSNGVGIKDIALALRNSARPTGRLGEDMGEKTLQRELVSMVSEGILAKTGSKRWSRYLLNK